MSLRAFFPALIALLLVLTGCAQDNPARSSYCLAAVAGLEAGGERLLVEEIAASAGIVSVHYRQEGGSAEHRVTCRFAGESYEVDQLELIEVTLDGEPLGPGQLTFLKRYWLPGFSSTLLAERIVIAGSSFISMGKLPGQFLQMTLSALPLAAVYALLAAGFALIHGIIGRVSVAHGEFATVGAYAGYAGFIAFGTYAGMMGPLGALLFGLAASAGAGLLTASAVFVPLAKRTGQMFLVASVGLILVYEETIRLSNDARELWLPPILASPVSLTAPPYVVTVTPMQLAIVVAASLPLAALLIILRRASFGKAWRAVADDPLAAQLMGIDPAQVLRISSLTAAALAGWAGLSVLFAYGNANHAMGLMFGLKAMVAALAGGMGSVGGAIAGALLLVAIETAWVAVFGGAYRDAAVFILLIGLLTLSPTGLLGKGKS